MKKAVIMLAVLLVLSMAGNIYLFTQQQSTADTLAVTQTQLAENKAALDATNAKQIDLSAEVQVLKQQIAATGGSDDKPAITEEDAAQVPPPPKFNADDKAELDAIINGTEEPASKPSTGGKPAGTLPPPIKGPDAATELRQDGNSKDGSDGIHGNPLDHSK